VRSTRTHFRQNKARNAYDDGQVRFSGGAVVEKRSKVGFVHGGDGEVSVLARGTNIEEPERKLMESMVGKYACARTRFKLISLCASRFPAVGPAALCRSFILFSFLASAFAQGGPPYYTNDPGTPGHLNWEINLGYMPFYYSNRSVSHTPDLDINFGVGDRVQLTYENAWLRVQNPSSQAKFGLGQSNFGVKWRFYDAGESGLKISTFPQGFVNNPDHAVRRGITPATQGFLLPFEFSRKFGPADVDYELGYQFNHKGPDSWLTGLVVGHNFTSKFEMDMELYAQGTFHPSENQPTIGVGARYKIHRPVILLLMTGRSLEPTRPNQSYFVGYFGLQFLLPPRSYKSE
jgi:hypothetical protein